jgi:hypothetical protein
MDHPTTLDTTAMTYRPPPGNTAHRKRPSDSIWGPFFLCPVIAGARWWLRKTTGWLRLWLARAAASVASDAVTFAFRNRMILSAGVASPDDINRVVLSDDNADELVEILGPQGDENFWDAMEFRLRGSGYPTREAAIEAGKLWRNRLTIAFAHYDRGIELGPDDTPAEPRYSLGHPKFPRGERRRMRDSPKLVVFQTGNEPQWGGFSADFDVTYAIEGLIRSPLAWCQTTRRVEVDR